jgi:hypothetical protein
MQLTTGMRPGCGSACLESSCVVAVCIFRIPENCRDFIRGKNPPNFCISAFLLIRGSPLFLYFYYFYLSGGFLLFQGEEKFYLII